ncbi:MULTISPECIES: DUF3658 domain-containing protein [unclassified Methylobacterium]|uniref:DUF3658 domain-containing protein n=1 Tax=unclassified Methylobacterium TaxID=2615210 RepID=UPI00226A1F18|nr:MULTISPECIES: DUF3658 domain-containing protein [unclassified Methylobacterium]
MSERTETVHVTYGVSRADSVRDALLAQGCEAPVIGLPSALNLGPINPPDPEVRRAWFRTVLRCQPDEMPCEPEQTWTDAISSDVRPVYWVCMTDAAEHASFLEFAFRMAGRPFDIVDATGLDFVTRDGVRAPWSLGIMRSEDIVASGLKDTRRPLSRAEGDAASEAWRRLRSEDAPIRVVRSGRLVSTPLTHFDGVLIDQATTGWQVVARLIGRTLAHLTDDVDPPGQGVSDIVLFGRIRALGDDGALDVRGPGPGLRDYEVQLPLHAS